MIKMVVTIKIKFEINFPHSHKFYARYKTLAWKKLIISNKFKFKHYTIG